MTPTLFEQLTRDQLFELVASVAAEIAGRDQAEVRPDSSMRSDLSMDSLEDVEMALELEERCGKSITDEDMENLRTINDVVDLLEKLQAKG